MAAALVVTGGGILATGGMAAGSAAHASAHGKATRSASSPQSVAPLRYGGGKLLTASKTYAIFWGPSNQFPSDLVGGITKLLGGFGGSNYLNIAAQYLPVAPTSTFEGSIFDPSAPPSHGLSVAEDVAEVAKVITTPDPNGIYLVYTSNFPQLNYCAYHAAGVINGVIVQTGYLPNTDGVAGCDPGDLFPVNRYGEGTRSIADSTAHEFMEATTDPVPYGGWADKNRLEIGDKCNFVYGGPVKLANGSRWQIQEEWSNAAGGCVQGS